MIIVVGGTKGGTGKSTVATNLAVIRSNADKDVLLIDADEQETSADFTIVRNNALADGAGYTCIQLTDVAVRTETLRLKSKYDDIFIDTGGRDSTSQRAALSVADVLLVPFAPRSFDVWTIEKVASLVSEIQLINPNLKVFAFISKGDPRGQENEQAANFLKENNRIEFIDTPLIYRKAFGDAAGKGLAVTEQKPEDAKAICEIMTLYRHLFDVFLTSS